MTDIKQQTCFIQMKIVYILKERHWALLDNANLVGYGLCQGKKDFDNGGVFFGLSLCPKTK